MQTETNPEPKREQRCRFCGGRRFVRGEGSGPHHAALLCAGCGRHVMWIRKPKPAEEAP